MLEWMLKDDARCLVNACTIRWYEKEMNPRMIFFHPLSKVLANMNTLTI
jgi:hypothetical protein